MKCIRKPAVPFHLRIRNAAVFSLVAIPCLAFVANFLRYFQSIYTPFYEWLPNSSSIQPDHCNWDENERRVVSMSLFGSLDKHTLGVLRNSERIAQVYPGWTLRVYLNRSNTDEEYRSSLLKRGVEIVDVVDAGLAGIPPLMWRFAVAIDDSVNRFLVRDADSRLSAREAACVEAWRRSCKPLHIIRDHPSHSAQVVSGGLWGGTRGALPAMGDTLSWAEGQPSTYMGDMRALEAVLWPAAQRGEVLQHDSFSCLQWGAHPFPVARTGSRRRGFDFVGAVFDPRTERPEPAGQAALLRALPEPPACVPRGAATLPGGWRHPT